MNEAAETARARPRALPVNMLRWTAMLVALPVVFLLLVIRVVVDIVKHGDPGGQGVVQGSNAGSEKSSAPPMLVAETRQPASAARDPASQTERKELVAEPCTPVAAALHHVVQIDGVVVVFGVYTADPPRISRLARMPTERLAWQRAKLAFRRRRLADFTPAMASQCAVSYDLDGAIAVTRRELRSAPSAPSAQSARARVAPSSRGSALPGDAVHAPATGATHAADLLDAVDEARQTAHPTVATGVVTAAGPVRVSRPGKKPYTAFQVVVADSGGRSVFAGVELQHMFDTNVFGIHDRVHLERIREDYNVDLGGGRMEKRIKNSYKVVVLERAPS